ncbi:hypothetical protein VPH35_100338 [Triticum aestivum]
MMHIIDRAVPPQEECRYASNDNEEDHEMLPFNSMIQSNGSNDVTGELFCRQSTNGHGPIGLNLKKTTSVLNSIQKKLVPASKVKRKESTFAIHTRTTVIQGMKPSKKLRASHFEASILRIGDWEFKSRLKGDIVAKFYYSNSKMVWETIQEGLKSKMEIKCSDICALKITCQKKLPGVLDIMVCAEPRFFKETKTLPYRRTRWVVTTDFTGGQARRLSRHVLQCDPGIIDKHIENLLSIDHRLYLLSQENNINQKSPCWGTCCSVPGIALSPSNENSYHSDDDNLFGTAPTGQSMPTGTNTVGLNDTGALQGVHFQSSVAVGTSVITKEHSRGGDQLKSDMFSWEEFLEMTRVGQKPFMSNGGLNGKGKHINNLTNSEDSHSRAAYPSRREALAEVIRIFPGDCMTSRQVESGNQPSRADHVVLYPSSEEPSGQTLLQNQPSNGYISPETMSLEQIHDNLLSDNEVVNVEQQDLMSTVNSLSCLIGQAAAVAPPPPPPHAEPAQVINVAPSESSSAGNQFSPWMELPSSAWEP